MTLPSRRPSIFVAEPDSFDAEARTLLDRSADVVLCKADRQALGAAFAEHDAVWIRLGFRIDEEVLGPAPRCRVLACPATGLDHIDLEACRKRDIQVVSLKGEVEFLRDIRATAELTIGLALALLRRIPAATCSVLDGVWNRDLFRGNELHEKTVGLVGVGRLGSLVSKMMAGFDANVIGYDPRPDFPTERATRVGSLTELMARSDIVSIHVSYDPSTRHLVGAGEIAAMRSSAVLINTSRGGVLDESALLDALGGGRIAGAALDVMEGEPHPSLATHPLVRYARAHDNLLLVPHIGGNTWESTRKTEIFIAKRVLRALGGPA